MSAASLKTKADRLMAEAMKMLDGIPPGQPVMSRRHRNLLDRHLEKVRGANELYKQFELVTAQQQKLVTHA